MAKAIGKLARSLMVQGTSSHVGKSVLTAAFLRILRGRGIKAVPFKAQNMALNSFVTMEGAEIGRAQAFQAEAAGVEPSADMNPILLKPTGEARSQVIIQGRVFGSMSAVEYHAFKKEAARYVRESYDRLASRYEAIVIEGAGSPAEVNLRENDLANMGIAEMTGSPVVLVGDIDRGGVFASIVGTLELLTENERARVKGLIINKFRGDMRLLESGLDFLSSKTGRPVLGVVPHLKDILLPDEDGVALEGSGPASNAEIRIAVIKLPRISNFTDFDPLRMEQGVSLSFIDDPGEVPSMDAVIIPGTKNTIEDLRWVRERGFGKALSLFRENGGALWGICGGFQMMGTSISDPHGVESGGEAEGLGFLKARTVLEREKKTFQVKAEASGMDVAGYEIHMGETVTEEAPFSIIKERGGVSVEIGDGAAAPGANLWGTYIHGIFDNDGFRAGLLDGLRARKGIAKAGTVKDFKTVREASIDSLASHVEKSVDMEAILKIMGLAEPLS